MPHTLLSGVVGSQAYGLATPESDVDTMSVHVEPTMNLVGINKAPEATIETKNPDSVSHEVGKFLWLALEGNPNIQELLWLKDWTHLTGYGEWLISIRQHFLSQQVKERYLGYANNQFKKFESSGGSRFGNVPVNRNEKNARHLLRLVRQGKRIWLTGRVELEVPNPEELRAEARFIAAHPAGPTHALRVLATAEKFFDETPTSLPELPRRDRAEELLAHIRRTHMN
ncbi:tRNA nucleotidyltransferase [Gordonia phage Bantam]|uniref:tRNA nucleotidyltransferase n=1 Tax=Gordonia phage Bantam TaxID=1887641 RepID=A0A1B3AYF6_9CAUD|nr:nucleotidyltransferase [Gordonia phage Bantam]AOE43788.1 tRNA nucleotidyltransferase [Gordonia phage Bantam]